MPVDVKRALVTGASSGIGRDFALQLAMRGYAVTLVARREDKLRELLAGMAGDQHRVLVADLSSANGVQAVVDTFAYGHIQLLVNNAGYSVLEPFSESSLAVQQNILNVNCSAVITLAHVFLNQALRGDALINLASIVSYLPTPAQPLYSASKAFIAAFSECLWSEQKQRGIYVMGLCPGVTQTEFIATATGGSADGQNLPKLMTQSSTDVVAQALAALDKRNRAIVVTGWINRILLLMPRFLSRHRLLKVLSVLGDPERAL